MFRGIFYNILKFPFCDPILFCCTVDILRNGYKIYSRLIDSSKTIGKYLKGLKEWELIISFRENTIHRKNHLILMFSFMSHIFRHDFFPIKKNHCTEECLRVSSVFSFLF